MTDAVNPFDAYANPEDEAPTSELTAGPAPSLWESFKTGAGHAFGEGGILGAARDAADVRTMNRTDVAQPGDSPLLGKPTQAEVDAARGRVEDRRREAAAYEAFHSDTVAGKAAGLLGTLAGGALLPESFLSAGGLVSGGVVTGLRAAGATGALARIAGGAAEAGAVNTGIDAATQGLDIAAGTQQGYDPLQGAASFGVGAVLGGGMHAVAEGLASTRARREGLEAQGQPAPSPDARGAPPLTIRPAARVEPTMPGVAPGRQDGVAPPVALPAAMGPDAPAPVVMADPAIVAAQARAQQQAAAIPDRVLDKVAGAVALTDPASTAGDGTVRVPLSIEEAAAVRQAGLDVDENGVMPAEQAAGLVAERNRRDTQPPPKASAESAQPQAAPEAGVAQASTTGQPAATPETLAPDPAQVPPGPLPEAPEGASVTSIGRLGPVVQGLKGRWADAVAWLRSAKTGDVQGVLEHPDVPGAIDVVWGNKRGGLRHIIERHPEVVDDLPERLARMSVISRSDNRIILGSQTDRAVVRLTFDGQSKTWLMTAYEMDGRPAEGRTGRPSDLGADTRSSAPPTDTNMRLDGGDVKGSRPEGGVVEGAPSEGADPSSPAPPTEGTVAEPPRQTAAHVLPGDAAHAAEGGSGSGRGRDRDADGREPPDLDGLTDPRAQQMAARAGAKPTAFDPNSRFPNRRALAGEDGKPRTLPADASPAEIQAHRVTDVMRSIAARMDRKLEVDRRFSSKGSLGEYKPAEGVLRIRQDGDIEVFSHELGHAVDQRLANDAATAAEWRSMRDRFAAELRPLDANTTDPAAQTVAEGVAEFLRSTITNPAYARKQAPRFAEAFDRLVDARDPELRGILADAARLSQIDSGLAPMDAFRTMVAPGSRPHGLAAFRAEARRHGLIPTLSLWYDRMYAAIVSPDHWAKRFQDQLREARFQKTGTPLPEFGWADPYKKLRMLPGARQAALDAVYYGVRPYGASFRDAVQSASIHNALSEAFGGHVTLIADQDHPMVKAFSGYLVARRARALYDRFTSGDLRNPPVRASQNETLAAIADFEKTYPQFAGAADKVFDFARAMWTKKFESGLIDRGLYAAVAGRGDDYVPFQRDFLGSKAEGRGGPAGAGQERSIVKAIRGSSRDIIDPVHALIYDAVQTERVIALNDVFKALHDLARSAGEFAGRYIEQVPNTELRAESVDLAEAMRAAARKAGLEKADTETMLRTLEDMVGDDMSATVFRSTQTTARGERIAFYWRDGQRVALKLGDDEISKAFFDTMTATSAAHRDLLLAMFGKINGLFSQLCVQAPQFAIKNLLMDNISRLFIARNTGVLGRTPGAGIAAGAYTMLFDREFAKAYAAFGGHRGGVVAAASRDLATNRGMAAVTMKPRSLTAMRAEVIHLLGHPKDLAVHVATAPYHAAELVMKLIEGTETMGRLGQAKIVFNHLRKQGLTDEEAFHGANFEARDTLDYDRRGAAMNAATKLAVFLNPAIQATERSARVLAGDPVRAAIEAYNRGGYSHLDEASKSAIWDAVKNYGMVSLGAAATLLYTAWNADDPVYQNATPYMRLKYFLFPLGRGDGDKQMMVTVPKPFDHAGGIMAAVEAAFYGLRRQDPQTWANVRAALLDGFLPRQLGSFQDFMTANPHVKTAYEVMTGQKLGFAGDNPRPIVPENMAKLPPELQYNGYSSYFARLLGRKFGISPLVADHVISSEGGTFGKDLNYLVTGLLDDQPNVTLGDALTRMFFGSLYREATGGGARNDVMDLMARTSGQYAQAAAGYLDALKMGDREAADGYYRKASDTAKVLMTMEASKSRSGAGDGFTVTERQLHPLIRTRDLGAILASVTRDLAMSHVQVMDRGRSGLAAAQYIDVTPEVARSIGNTIRTWSAEEARNGLAAVKEPGYAEFPQIDTSGRLDAVYAADPAVGEELRARMSRAHILPMPDVVKAWPEVQRRLLQDREKAKVADLLPPGVTRVPPRASRKKAAAAAAVAAVMAPEAAEAE